VLVQLGLLPEYLPWPAKHPVPTSHAGTDVDDKAGGTGKWLYRVPASGIECAEKMREKDSRASNEMFGFGMRKEK
jgi:carboxymethylenebutenolidase